MWLKDHICEKCEGLSGQARWQPPPPQGSVLGPVLFFKYINDLLYQTSVDKTIQFADNTTLIFEADSIRNLEIKLFIDSNITSQYFAE